MYTGLMKAGEKRTDSDAVRYFGCAKELMSTEKIAELSMLASVVRPIAIFPDFGKKKNEDAEIPRSLSVVTAGTVIPEATSSSLGCGSGIIQTDILADSFQISDFKTMVSELVSGAAEEKTSALRNVLIWLGLTDIRRSAFDPRSKKELLELVAGGASGLAKCGAVANNMPGRIEYGGNAMTEEDKRILAHADIIPRSAVRFLSNLGVEGFSGNHYIGAYAVEEVLRKNEADSWGVTKGRVVFLYHSNGGTLPFILGRYFGTRKQHRVKETVLRLVPKILFHFGSFSGLRRVLGRWKNYFSAGLHEIPISEAEGKRMFLAHKAALNASYAHHALLSQKIITSAERVWKGATASLLWLGIHYTIVRESREAGNRILHMNRTVRVFPGKPYVLSGHEDMPSYLAVGLHAGDASPHTAPFSAALYAEARRGKGHVRESGSVMRFAGRNMKESRAPYYDDEAMTEVMQALEREKIAVPVARLRPLAVYFGSPTFV